MTSTKTKLVEFRNLGLFSDRYYTHIPDLIRRIESEKLTKLQKARMKKIWKLYNKLTRNLTLDNVDELEAMLVDLADELKLEIVDVENEDGPDTKRVRISSS
jgi:hypothetical protein